MSGFEYCIDVNQVVHIRCCADIQGNPTAYKHSKEVDSPWAMVRHVERPDRKDNREAPGLLTACPACLGGEE